MQCETFELRLHESLDRRSRPDGRPDLAEHAEQCDACGRLLTDYRQLIDGVDVRSQLGLTPESPPDLADRVLADIERHAAGDLSPASTASRRILGVKYRSLAMLAVAASLLVAAYTVVTIRTRPTQAELAEELNVEPETLQTMLELPLLSSFDEENVASMCRATGRGMATLPSTVWQVTYSSADDPALDSHGRWARPVAAGIRPLADSMIWALGMLRGALPGSPANPDAASPSATDTSQREAWPPSQPPAAAV